MLFSALLKLWRRDIKKVLNGPIGNQNTLDKKPKPFGNLSKAGVEFELLERHLAWRQK